MLQRVLHIDHAPLGKWPSRYAPAFMQQFAINLAISNNSEFPPFLSVNGPPGTGKTTMLKEVIADAIVKKAMVMSNFPNPMMHSPNATLKKGTVLIMDIASFLVTTIRLIEELIKFLS